MIHTGMMLRRHRLTPDVDERFSHLPHETMDARFDKNDIVDPPEEE